MCVFVYTCTLFVRCHVSLACFCVSLVCPFVLFVGLLFELIEIFVESKSIQVLMIRMVREKKEKIYRVD